VRTTAAAALELYERAMRLRGRSPATVATNLDTARRFLAAVRRPVLRLRRHDLARYLADLRSVVRTRAWVVPAIPALRRSAR
jgi:hypothetical protein